MRIITNTVKRSKDYEETLQKLGGKGATLFPTLREALSFAAVLGYKENRKLPLNVSAGTEDIAGAQYQNNKCVDIIFAISLAESKTADIFKEENEKDCIAIYEEYANGGLNLIQEWLEQYADLNIEDALWRGLATIGFKPPLENDNEKVVEPNF